MFFIQELEVIKRENGWPFCLLRYHLRCFPNLLTSVPLNKMETSCILFLEKLWQNGGLPPLLFKIKKASMYQQLKKCLNEKLTIMNKGVACLNLVSLFMLLVKIFKSHFFSQWRTGSSSTFFQLNKLSWYSSLLIGQKPSYSINNHGKLLLSFLPSFVSPLLSWGWWLCGNVIIEVK